MIFKPRTLHFSYSFCSSKRTFRNYTYFMPYSHPHSHLYSHLFTRHTPTFLDMSHTLLFRFILQLCLLYWVALCEFVQSPLSTIDTYRHLHRNYYWLLYKTDTIVVYTEHSFRKPIPSSIKKCKLFMHISAVFSLLIISYLFVWYFFDLLSARQATKKKQSKRKS